MRLTRRALLGSAALAPVGLLAATPAAAAWDPANQHAAETYSHPYRCDAYLQGDSLLVGMVRVGGWFYLSVPAGVRSAVECRTARLTSESVDALYRQASWGSYLAPRVVLAVGSNDCRGDMAAFRAELERAVQICGTNRRLILVDVFRSDGVPFGQVNSQIRACATAHPAQVRVVRWSTSAAAHPEWISDGVHCTVAGYKARCQMVLAAVKAP